MMYDLTIAAYMPNESVHDLLSVEDFVCLSPGKLVMTINPFPAGWIT